MGALLVEGELARLREVRLGNRGLAEMLVAGVSGLEFRTFQQREIEGRDDPVGEVRVTENDLEMAWYGILFGARTLAEASPGQVDFVVSRCLFQTVDQAPEAGAGREVFDIDGLFIHLDGHRGGFVDVSFDGCVLLTLDAGKMGRGLKKRLSWFSLSSENDHAVDHRNSSFCEL